MITATDRKAICTACRKEVPSTEDLPEFRLGGDYKTSPVHEQWVRACEDRSRWYSENLAYPNNMVKNRLEISRLESIDWLKVADSQILLREVERTARADSFYCGCQEWA